MINIDTLEQIVPTNLFVSFAFSTVCLMGDVFINFDREKKINKKKGKTQ